MGDGGGSADVGMGLFLTSGHIDLFGTKGTPNINNFLIRGPFVADGQFHHVVATWTGDNSPNGVKYYIDGTLYSTTTALTTISNASTPLTFGGPVNTRFLPLVGLIDKASIYNRPLSSQEITTIFNAGSLGKCTSPLAAGQLQFSSATFSVNENSSNATITVVRTMGSDGSVTVNYSATSGTAMAGTDFTAVSGILVFANGETTKTFTIPIINDSLSEGLEVVNLTLSNFTGGAIAGTIVQAQLTILDDDISQCEQNLVAAQQQIINLQNQVNTLIQQNQMFQQQKGQLQNQYDQAQQQIQSLNTQLAVCMDEKIQLQNQISSLTQQNTQLQSQLVTANATIQNQQNQISSLTSTNQMLNAVLIGAINSFQQILQQEFNDPQFQIPGNTPTEQLQNIVNAISKLNHGQKEALYKNLGGKK